MSPSSFFWLPLFFPLFLHFKFNPTTAQTHVYEFCNLGGNYTANSTFQTNLNLLLSSISTSNSLNSSKFLNKTSGKDPDAAYGLFQCRGDQSSESCKKCADTAAKEITTQCPFRKESVIFYDECLVHYSDKSFLGSMRLDPTVYLSNTASVSEPDLFTPKLAKVMRGLVTQAIANSSRLYAVGRDNYTRVKSIYGLVQCTLDLSGSDCNRCLTRAISEFPGCCDRKQGGRVVKPSCIARYEIYDFVEPGTIRTPPPPPGVAPPTTNNPTGQKRRSSNNVIVIVVSVVVAVVLLSAAIIFFCVKKKKRFEIPNIEDIDEITSAESLQVNFSTVLAATDNFNESNKLGQGGFGAVYKGKLSDGQEIAVKRLATNSGQGVEEFKNEVLLLAKLQHRNLVRLLGFCLERNEKILIYEFVQNASLDHFIFDPVKRTYLDWATRYKVIGGIARGLLYLHEDSRDRIIHRDLKASNILLDGDMNPKIADFGMARLFSVDQTQACTSRVVGTYGYMAPEYAVRGHFSVKSDVFSFGVLVLEIISGRRNSSLFNSENSEDLLSYAWRQWEQGAPMELLDPILKEHHSSSEVMRCIHMGLLCVQEDQAKRPTMATVVLMLNSYSVTLPLPSQPAFLFSRPEKNIDILSMYMKDGMNTSDSSKWILHDRSISSSAPQSINDASITELEPR